jgi:CheY-like chemotaxis protein
LRTGPSTQGYEIIDAPNGRAAIELLAQKPDLITLDLNLPDIPGFELLKVISMRAETIPIVVLSGLDDGASKVQAFDLGADDYVTKPFGMDEFFLPEYVLRFVTNCMCMANVRYSASTISRSILSGASSKSGRGTLIFHPRSMICYAYSSNMQARR